MVEFGSNFFAKNIQGLFDEHKVDKVSYKRKLNVYQDAYPNFLYESPSMTLKENFETSNLDQFKAGPSGKALEVESIVLIEMKAKRTTIKEILGEHVDTC